MGRALLPIVNGSQRDEVCGGQGKIHDVLFGAPLDPWLRTHWWLGGQIIATAPQSQTMTGTVQEWEARTGMVLPATGEHLIPRGLSTLHIDIDEDRGTYTEPNVWVRHR